MQSGFRSIIHGAEDIRDDSGDGTDVEDETAGGDEERDEGLRDGDYAEEVGFEAGAGVVEIDFEGWEGAVASSIRVPNKSVNFFIPFHLADLLT